MKGNCTKVCIIIHFCIVYYGKKITNALQPISKLRKSTAWLNNIKSLTIMFGSKFISDIL